MRAVIDDRVSVTDEAAKAFLISGELWRKIEPRLSERVNTHRSGGGRPRASSRACMGGIFSRL